MKTPVLPQRISNLKSQSISTVHRRIVTCVVLLMLLYLPSYGKVIWKTIEAGGSDYVLNFGFIGLAIRAFYQRRSQIQQMRPTDEDRWLGYILLGVCIALIPVALTSVSLKSLLVMVAVIGLILSSWGIPFLASYWKYISLFLVSIYPSLEYLVIQPWRLFGLEQMLESVMATLGSLGLQIIQFPAISEGKLIKFPQGAVEVASGCSGFSMAFALAGSGLIMGLWMYQSRRKIIQLMAAGVAVAMVLNVPRIMLLAIASVYWGQQSFDFWHGPIGGQMFATLLFTIYYYLMMAIIEDSPDRDHGSDAP